MEISKLHYVTNNIAHAEEACKGGIDWIQLRVKHHNDDDWKMMAEEAKIICKKYNARLIVNDSVKLAKMVKADGVHLGKDDMPPDEARDLLGPDFIIGGTANTFDDIHRLALLKVNYIGLGPFRFTKTKTNLSPLLGLQGYLEIMKKCEEENISVPVIAIGGIKEGDVKEILSTGVYGIAVSSAISESKDISATTKAFIQKIKNVHV